MRTSKTNSSAPAGAEGRLHVHAATHVGRVREANEDAFLVRGADQDSPGGGLVAVCDGLGGHFGGAAASQAAVEALAKGFPFARRLSLREQVRRSMEAAHQAVRGLARHDARMSESATTCVAVAIEGGETVLAHVGDSRAYLLREGRVTQLTKDHSFGNELIARGLATEESAARHPDAEVLTRCFGLSPRLEVDFRLGRLRDGDRLLLCSDGLYRHLTEEDLADILIGDKLDAVCAALIDTANARGGSDNITVAVLAWHEGAAS